MDLGPGEQHLTAAVRVATVALLVHDYDTAIDYYTTALGLALVADQPQADGERFVVLGGIGSDPGAGLLLVRAVGDHERSRVGDQAAGRVAFFLETTDFDAQHRRMVASGVVFAEEPRHEPYGTVAVFTDLYDNRWDLLQPAGP